ncbi:class I SAM-dependent methyltransferase [Burkholderia sp. Ac-20345]|uniref:class I SAM-dependent methyltransferase n=1 Tax=Burkholderia sp. Ac-20345 TaxID=2703891 RepID=UPI00197BCD4C|nr:class I SAM-dependent methyltransferase [Burkholderia sp. Ac-20345]MBN3781378.1 class I SAM-dependent methyltransferase [Burkholderia sp. Ac-20345]
MTSCRTHAPAYVPETRFGVWFLRTHTWEHRVLRVAIDDLKRLIAAPLPAAPVILDAGCGQGKSFRLLSEAFSPDKIIGIDCHNDSLAHASGEARHCATPVELHHADCTQIPLADSSVDIVFCHQTFHHLVDQEPALADFRRVLKPGGLLLFAESTDAYIKSWVIRLLFRHPMEVQRSADGYLAMLRDAGFAFESGNVSFPYLWWSRAKDFGLLERIGLYASKPGKRRETLVNVAARKPA